MNHFSLWQSIWALSASLTASAWAAPSLAVESFDPFGAVDITGRPGDPVPMDVPFVDENGHAVTLRNLAAGRPILLAPVYYECANICSVVLSSVMKTLAAVPLDPGEDYTFVAFSINPREGPVQASTAKSDALLRFGPEADERNFHFLTGSEKSIRAVSDAVGFRFAWDERSEEYAHATALALITGGGRLARWIHGISFSPMDLRLALLEAGEGSVGSITDKLLLLCYHYDPATGRYGSLVRWILLAGGLLTLLAIGLFIATCLWREQRRRPQGEAKQ